MFPKSKEITESKIRLLIKFTMAVLKINDTHAKANNNSFDSRGDIRGLYQSFLRYKIANATMKLKKRRSPSEEKKDELP